MKILSSTIKSYDSTYKSGYDKDYPSLELVRIEKIFFKKKGDTITPENYFSPLTGDPGGSSSVSYDTFCISPCEIERISLI